MSIATRFDAFLNTARRQVRPAVLLLARGLAGAGQQAGLAAVGRRAGLTTGLVIGLVAGLLAGLGMAPTPLAAQGGGGGGSAMIHRPENPLLSNFRWRSIGPGNMGGRVDDFAVVERDTRIQYVGYATAGAWKTENNGVTWRPIFDTYGTSSVGGIDVSQSNPDIVWIGTGEANNRQSSSYGDGVYKSTDGGATFQHMGLTETENISRIAIHPTNPNIVWVAANGSLFRASSDRGIYKTTDGGVTWRKVNFVDDDTGFTELAVNQSNPNILFAASYQRRRSACCFVGGGPGSGIWTSEDGGESWRRLSGNGLPNGTMGRVALDIHRANPNIIYAQIEVAPDREPAGSAPGQGNADPQSSGVWRSLDGGATWEFRSNQNVRPMYFSILRVDPNDPEVVYTGGVQAYQSMDGGRTWRTLSGFGHVDHHALWINPNNSNHVLLGNDGGVDVSYDRANTWMSIRTKAIGQFYHVSVDMRRPYWVYGGLQDNGSWAGPSSSRGGNVLNEDWMRLSGGDGFYTQVDTTDNMTVFTESQNGNIQRLNLRDGSSRGIRPNQNTIVPRPAAPPQLRWHWNTPILLSPHNPKIVYTGANRFFKSMDLGDTWTMSEDLSKQIPRDTVALAGFVNSLPNCTAANARGRECILSKNDGVNGWGMIITISESPIVPGILWVGTDDGNVQLSRDGGATWTEVGRNVPGAPHLAYVSRVEASNFDPATAYISIDAHRDGDNRPYVYVTRDFGATWTSLASNLPVLGNVNVIRQDRKNPRLLFAGTELGFFVSLNEGASWERFMPNLPTARVDHVEIHPRENDLVLATHARSIWIMDDITALQQFTPQVEAKDVHLFEPREAVQWVTDRRFQRAPTGAMVFRGENAPAGTAISYYLRTPVQGGVLIQIHDISGEVVRTLQGPGGAGIHRVAWNLRAGGAAGGGQAQQGPLLPPGTYRVTLLAGGRQEVQFVRILEDIWLQPW